MENPYWVSGTQLWPSTELAIVSVWGMSQLLPPSSSPSLCLSPSMYPYTHVCVFSSSQISTINNFKRMAVFVFKKKNSKCKPINSCLWLPIALRTKVKTPILIHWPFTVLSSSAIISGHDLLGTLAFEIISAYSTSLLSDRGTSSLFCQRHLLHTSA